MATASLTQRPTATRRMISDDVRKSVLARMERDETLTLYRIAQESGVAWSLVKRFLHEGKQLQSDQLDKLGEWAGLVVGEKDPEPNEPKKKLPPRTPPRKRG